MNKRKAKQLRAIAQRVTVGQPERLYVRNVKTGVIRLAKNSTKGMYRALKRAARQERRAKA